VSFIWPTSGRRIVEGYGERTNPETGTVTLNPGINIAAPSGSLVVASEDGVVSLVSWLPSYGTIVIVEHRDGYRTVYGNLAGALVSRGTSVDAGERIGTVGGGSLHFEIWRGQTRLNPTTVLR
jgi:murein DD-endopeptidase MepM/ murein hydrolase activator NlpD